MMMVMAAVIRLACSSHSCGGGRIEDPALYFRRPGFRRTVRMGGTQHRASLFSTIHFFVPTWAYTICVPFTLFNATDVYREYERNCSRLSATWGCFGASTEVDRYVQALQPTENCVEQSQNTMTIAVFVCVCVYLLYI